MHTRTRQRHATLWLADRLEYIGRRLCQLDSRYYGYTGDRLCGTYHKYRDVVTDRFFVDEDHQMDWLLKAGLIHYESQGVLKPEKVWLTMLGQRTLAEWDRQAAAGE